MAEWIEISPHGFCQKVVEQMNCVLLLGEDTGKAYLTQLCRQVLMRLMQQMIRL